MSIKLKDYSFGRVSISDIISVLEICFDKLEVDEWLTMDIYDCKQRSYINPLNKFKRMIRVKAYFISEYDAGGSTSKGYLYFTISEDKTELKRLKLKVYDRIKSFRYRTVFTSREETKALKQKQMERKLSK